MLSVDCQLLLKKPLLYVITCELYALAYTAAKAHSTACIIMMLMWSRGLSRLR